MVTPEFLKDLLIIKNLRPKGNILAVSLLVSGVAAATIFSVGAIAISDVKISSQLEDAAVAYQAASAGLELGLLYYRYNHNTELSNGCTDFSNPTKCQTEPTEQEGTPVRFYLDRLGCTLPSTSCQGVAITNNATEYISTNATLANLPRTERVVDVKIWYKNTTLGNVATINDIGNENIKIGRDETYSIGNLKNGDKVRLWLRPGNWAEELKEYKDTHSGNEPSVIDTNDKEWFQDSFCDNSNNPNIVFNQSSGDKCGFYISSIPHSRSINQIIALREAFSENGHYNIPVNISASQTATMHIRPINIKDGAQITAQVVDDTGQSRVIDTGITHIESTGYFGKAKRKLEIQINRQNSTYLGIFDRALYVGQGNLTP